MGKFYIIQLTYWAGDGIKPIAGPMSREEAEAQSGNYPYIPGGGDIGERARVASRDWLAEYGFPYSTYGETLLTEYLELTRNK